jgi:hypothetical protein
MTQWLESYNNDAPVNIEDAVEAAALARDPSFQRDYINSCWHDGNLRYQLRPHGQTDLYTWIKAQHKERTDAKPFIAQTHRRLGKTYLWALIAVERCLSKARQVCRFAGPTKKQVQNTLEPNLARVLLDCPPHLQPLGS